MYEHLSASMSRFAGGQFAMECAFGRRRTVGSMTHKEVISFVCKLVEK